MASKRPSPLDEPPTASSSSEQEEEEVPSSQEDEDEVETPPLRLHSDDSDSGSDYEHRWVAKPITSKPKPKNTTNVNVNVNDSGSKRVKKNTEDPHSTKPPENKSRSVGVRVEQQVKSKSNGKDPSLNSKMMGLPLPVPGLSEDVIKRGLELMGASKRAELDKRWKDLQLAELELNAKCAQLISHHAKLIWEAYNSSSTH